MHAAENDLLMKLTYMLVPTPFSWLFSTEIFESLIKQGGSQSHGLIFQEVVHGWLVHVSVR